MKNLVRAEIRKITTTRLALALTAGGVLLVAFYATVITFSAGAQGSQDAGIPALSDPGSVRLVYGVPLEIGYLMPLVLGVTLISGEFRHRTITTTFLVNPRRRRIAVAKVIAAGVVGLAMGVILTAFAAAVGGVLIAARGYPVLLGSHGIPRLLAMAVIGLSVWCIFGAGFGALLKNQTAAVVAAIVLVTVVGQLLTLFLNWVGLGSVAQYLPSNASTAIIAPTNSQGSELLPWWAGGLVLLAWGLLTAAAGSFVTLRRDITS